MAQTDKLALFVEDMRRAGVECLPPDINASRADFSVEEGEAVRYALGALERRRRESDGGAGRRARGQRPVRQPRGFRRADRPAIAQPPPDRKPCRRRRVRRARARPRGRVRSGRDDARPRGQRRRPALERAGGAVRRRGHASVRADPPAARASWTLAQRMAAERDAFGFYFSAHPVDAQRHLLAAHQVKTFARARLGSGGSRWRPLRRDHGRAGRGSALAHLGARAAAI